MDTIKLESKTTALPGVIESYWFENEHTGLKKTRFHRLTIPLQPFDSGLDYEEQPVDTAIVFEWYRLNLTDPENLDGLNLSHEQYADAEASVYVGNAHNVCQVKRLELKLLQGNEFQVTGDLLIEFEREGVAKNEPFRFETTATFNRT